MGSWVRPTEAHIRNVARRPESRDSSMGKLTLYRRDVASVLQSLSTGFLFMLTGMHMGPPLCGLAQAANPPVGERDIKGEWKGQGPRRKVVNFTFANDKALEASCTTDLFGDRAELWRATGVAYTNGVVSGWLTNSVRTNVTISVFFSGKFEGNSCRMRLECADGATEVRLLRSPSK